MATTSRHLARTARSPRSLQVAPAMAAPMLGMSPARRPRRLPGAALPVSTPGGVPSCWRPSSTGRSQVADHSSGASEGAQAAVDPQVDAATAAAADAGSASTASGKDAETAKAELAEKDRQIAEYKDLYLRARAEFDNLQKRTAREKQAAKDYAIQSFAKDLVNDLDVLQLALASVDEGQRTGPDAGKVKDLWEGVNSTRKMLEQTLGRFGVTSFDPEGQTFDPNKHEAMFQAPIPGKEPNTVVCQKIGWMLRDRILRPAQVGVVQGST